VCLVPGRRPLSSLCAALAPRLGTDEEALLSLVREEPGVLAGRLRQRLGPSAGVVLFLDQMEELVTQSDAAEADLFAEVLGHLAERQPGVRVLATLRGDHLMRVARLPGLARALVPALYLLPPLSACALREAIERPARLKGHAFESEPMIAELVETTL